MSKKLLLVPILFLLVLAITPVIKSATTAEVTATVTAQNVAVFVKDGSVAYGNVSLSSGACSTTTSDTQSAVNSGNIAENFNIKSADSTNWDIATSAPGSEIYTHQFTTTTGSYWQFIDNEYVTLETGLAADATSTVDTYILLPTDTASYGEQSITITVQAVAQ